MLSCGAEAPTGLLTALGTDTLFPRCCLTITQTVPTAALKLTVSSGQLRRKQAMWTAGQG